jgi:hypothetical protein
MWGLIVTERGGAAGGADFECYSSGEKWGAKGCLSGSPLIATVTRELCTCLLLLLLLLWQSLCA